MFILKIIATSALVALLVGAGVYALITAAIKLRDLWQDWKNYEEWDAEQKEFREW